jgi:gluconolactonase
MTDVTSVTTMVVINPIGDNLEVGTRAHWDSDTQNLYYVDVPQSTIYRYRPATGIVTKARVGDEPLAFAFPVEGKDDQFVAGLGRKVVILRWDGVSKSVCSCHTVKEVDRQPELSTNRLNGGKVDPFGRLWAGTMGGQDDTGETIPGRGSLYSFTQGKVKRHLKEIGISNGIAFDTELNKMYYVDTLFPGIYEFDYDGENGEISNRKIVFKFEDNCISGKPDGLTIDKDGNLWLAVIYGSAVLKIDPRTGSMLKKIEMPTSQITALTWGNKLLNVLYVNSAKMPVDGKVPEEPAGSTFKLEYLGKSTGEAGVRYKL